jgi:predicted  nucleic acid-binding Zn-ribbon protein
MSRDWLEKWKSGKSRLNKAVDMQQEKKADRKEGITSGDCQKSAFTSAIQRLRLVIPQLEVNMETVSKITKTDMGRRLNHFFDMWHQANADYSTRHD